MSRARNCPDFWDRVLKAVGGPAFIAGGAVRDFYMQHYCGHPAEAKDIDVFVPKDWLGSIGKRIRNIRPDALEYVFEGSDPTVKWIETYEFEGWEVQVIGLNLPEFTSKATMERMDLGLCQCAYDGTHWDFTDAFHRDAVDKTVTVVRADNLAQHDTSIKRATRIRYRAYPLFTIQPHKDFVIGS